MLNILQSFLQIKEKAFKKGIITREEMLRTQSDYFTSQRTLDQIQNQITSSQKQETDFLESWQQRLRDSEEKLASEQNQLNQLQAELVTSSTITSPISGIITGVHSSEGDAVGGNDALVSIATGSDGMDCIAYIDAQDGQRIQLHMQALISPFGYKKEEYGSIEGKVISVNPFPSTPESILAVLHNQDLVKRFTQDNTPHCHPYSPYSR